MPYEMKPYPFGLTNAEQEARLADIQHRADQLPIPVIIPREPEPNGSERPPLVLFNERLPNLNLPVFRHLQSQTKELALTRALRTRDIR